jgi:hypothetical protein
VDLGVEVVATELADNVSRRRLQCEHDARRPRVVRREQLTVDDQVLTRDLCRQTVRDHQEARLVRRSRELPHRPAQQVPEPADRVVLEQAGTVVRLVVDELASRLGAREIDDVQAAGPRLPIGRQRGAARRHAVGEPVHVGPVLLVERAIVLDARGAGRGTAVDEEVDVSSVVPGGQGARAATPSSDAHPAMTRPVRITPAQLHTAVAL